MVETEREIKDTVKSQQKRWLGHILRQLITENNVRRTNTGKKLYGRPKTMFLNWLLKTVVQRTKDVCPGQIKMESMKMEPNIWQNTAERDQCI